MNEPPRGKLQGINRKKPIERRSKIRGNEKPHWGIQLERSDTMKVCGAPPRKDRPLSLFNNEIMRKINYAVASREVSTCGSRSKGEARFEELLPIGVFKKR
jgi:hypothetical protein